MALKSSVLKRIEQAERSTGSGKVPDLVMIHYDWTKELWVACETYMIGKQNSKARTLYLRHFNDYAVPNGFAGTILVDDIDSPEGLSRDDEFDVVTVNRGRYKG